MDTNQRRKPNAHALGHLVSGLGSGVASATLLQPLDLLKTRQQQADRLSISASLHELRQSPRVVRALWKGTLPSVLRTGLGSALYFTSLNAMRERIGQLDPAHFHQSQSNGRSSVLPTISSHANLLSGALARTFAGFVLMPLTIVKVRFESNLYSYTSLYTATMDIWRANGVRGFFTGFGATAMRDAPYAGTYVLLYEFLKIKIASLAPSTQRVNAGDMSLTPYVASSINFTAAVFAGAGCSVVSNPFDAIKTRIQLQPQVYRNMWRACYTMIAEDGFRSLWSGLALRMSRKALSSALAWTVYEELIRRISIKGKAFQ